MSQGHDVVVYSLGLENEIAWNHMEGVRIVSGGRPDGSGYQGHIAAFQKWREFVSSYAPDILQSHVGLPDIYAAFTPVPQGSVKIRAALAPQLFPAQPIFGFFFERGVAKRAFDCHVAVSSGVAQVLSSTGIPDKKIVKIINPISSSIAEAIGKKFEGDSPFPGVASVKGIRIGYFGRFSPEKGPDRMIKWFTQFKDRLPKESRLLMAGMGKMEPELKDLARQLGVESQVEFVGYVKNPTDFLPYIHAAVSPSRYEGLPIAMIEAAALGCAVIATETDGAKELTNLAPNVLLIPNQDELSSEWFQKIAEWVQKQKMAKENPPNLTAEAVRSVRSEAVASDYLALYARLSLLEKSL